ncbi:hypothetical protein PFUGPA_05092 [Plasmodium falciparum Palo Alto/Uganda]|uniref:Uncharacterized protein n=1 Tax=Plasmodium falciparum (isolate Palo Alto / Uganda) TaxID=57270 RepID=W4ISP1_PLAFP|nr:hypothetical protein PFUGPA_05092 [Plasmodium falciparum Palo Alto/Uganda]
MRIKKRKKNTRLFYFFLKSIFRSMKKIKYIYGIYLIIFNAEENNIPIEKRKIRNYVPNKYTICDKCDFLVRPERAHHCRVSL